MDPRGAHALVTNAAKQQQAVSHARRRPFFAAPGGKAELEPPADLVASTARAQLSGNLQHLLAATDIAALFLDRELKVLQFAPPVSRLFGVRPDDHGRSISDLTHRLDYQALRADARAVLNQRTPIQHEVQDDAGRWYLTRVLPYRSPDDRIVGVVLTFVDITALKEAEAGRRQAMEQAARQLHTLGSALASFEDFVYLFDLEGRFVYANRALLNLWGIRLSEALGKNFAELGYPPELVALHRRQLAEVIETGQPIREENAFERSDGTAGHYEYIFTPIFGEDGTVTAVAGVTRDVTEQRQVVEVLRESQEALKTLNETLEGRVEERTRQVRRLASRLTRAEQEERRRISQVLHDDLQQLLYSVDMRMSMVRQRLQEADALEQAAAVAGEVQETRAWIGQAVAITRQLTVDLRPPILQAEGLANMLEWLQTQMRELHGLEVALEAEHDWYIADGDLRVLLFQIVRELLFNVKKHAATGRATVALAEEDGYLVIHVTDEGQGFDAAVVERREAPGGFGLFSVRERLELLGGRLAVRSRPGQGTHVEVYAPVQPEQPEE